MAMLLDPEERGDKQIRARRAVEHYVKLSALDRPRPDGEEDRRLNQILDKLAADLIELAAWFSECGAWTAFASRPTAPDWALPFLTEEERAGLGLINCDPTGADIPQVGGLPKKRKRKKGEEEPLLVMTEETVRYMAEHYDELPTIDHRTGGPAGEIL